MKTPAVKNTPTRMVRPGAYRRWGKRLFDLALVVGSSPFWLPVLGVCAVVVRWSMGSPVFFHQRRAGRGGQPFRIHKFRTMSNARAADGALLPDKDRLTRVGRWLRKTSLDELPELLNVLQGNMSLVGPRPLPEFYIPYYRPRELTRLHVLPGITGAAQVSGRNQLGWDSRLEHDAAYVEQCSLGLDCRVILKTLSVVVTGHGAAADADAAEKWLTEERSGEARSAELQESLMR